TSVSIADFSRVAEKVGLEVLLEFELEKDYQLPDGLISENQEFVNPTLYATMPTSDTLSQLLLLWKRFKNKEGPERGNTPWWNLFDMLIDLRVWGPKDRLTAENCRELEKRLPPSDEEEVQIELEHWPTEKEETRRKWKETTIEKIREMDGRIIDQGSIHEGSFHYEALLVRLAAGHVRNLINEPSAIGGLATLDGIQFILPQTIAQSLPSHFESLAVNTENLDPFDLEAPFRGLLLDGTPIAGHPTLDGGIVIEDVHDLVERSVVPNRRHATGMASLILHGDLSSDGRPIEDSRVLAIPLLIDSDIEATAPQERLFADLVHVALHRALEGDTPLAPDAFVINFSIGVRGSQFAGRISSLARLLDWWSSKAGVLFVVSAGNVQEDLLLLNSKYSKFVDLAISERQDLIRIAQRGQRYQRTLLSPSEALNVLTVGAASMDSDQSAKNATPRTVKICEDGEILPAISTAIGLGPFRCIKPDILAIGGKHEVRVLPSGEDSKLRVVQKTGYTGLTTASSPNGIPIYSKSRGTSSAAALVTRYLINAASALTAEGCPYEGQELSRIDLALLTRALAVNGATWPETANILFDKERDRLGKRHYQQAAEEVLRYFGYGFLNPELMYESPLHGATLVGLGRIKKDEGVIFDMPLPPSLSGEEIDRSMLVTLAWFSPFKPSRARYRLAALEAISASEDIQESNQKDSEWSLAMKATRPYESQISRGTVWSKRFVQKKKTVPTYSDKKTLPIRVQCRDASGGGLDRDEEIHFAIVVSLKLKTPILFDILEEIRDRLLLEPITV
ncbi:MAG: S8 family peptidase, partial [Rhodothermaceae bacterium]|nr:S8 family peptidase [Rhodothermaceae bacterium]